MLARAPSLFAGILCASCLTTGAARRAGLEQKLSDRERAAVALVRAEEISGHIRFLADDLLEGRAPGTRGSDLAIRYLATQLEAAGLQGGAQGPDGKRSFLQRVPLVKLAARVPP